MHDWKSRDKDIMMDNIYELAGESSGDLINSSGFYELYKSRWNKVSKYSVNT